MTRSHATIARQLRAKIGKHFEAISSLNYPSHEVYETLRSESDQATAMARYLGEHLQGVDRKAFGAACGVRLS